MTAAEQAKMLRNASTLYGENGAAILLREAADTIESLSRKLHDVDQVAEQIVEQLEQEYLMCRCKNKEACDLPATIGCCYDEGIKKAIEIVNRGLGQQARKGEDGGIRID